MMRMPHGLSMPTRTASRSYGIFGDDSDDEVQPSTVQQLPGGYSVDWKMLEEQAKAAEAAARAAGLPGPIGPVVPAVTWGEAGPTGAGVPIVVSGGGGIQPAAPAAKPDDGSTTKILIGVGVGAALLAALFFMTRGRSGYTPNKRKKAKRKSSKRARTQAMARSMARRSFFPSCRGKRPKGYPVAKKKYGYPVCYGYPLDSKKRVRSAISRFAAQAERYPPELQHTIAKRIAKAMKKYKVTSRRG